MVKLWPISLLAQCNFFQESAMLVQSLRLPLSYSSNSTLNGCAPQVSQSAPIVSLSLLSALALCGTTQTIVLSTLKDDCVTIICDSTRSQWVVCRDVVAPSPIVAGGCAAAKTIASLIIVIMMGNSIIKELDLALNGGLTSSLIITFNHVTPFKSWPTIVKWWDYSRSLV